MGSIGRLRKLNCHGLTPLLQWLLVSSFFGKCFGNFNLYLNTDEVKRTLGLSKELFYVTEGVPNTYALNFVVPVPATVNALHFTWKTLGQKPLPYSVSVDISDPITLEKPVLDIPLNGSIPTETETFTVFLLCTGKRSDEVFVELTINVTSVSMFRVNELTTIVLKRKKVCLEGNPDKLPKLTPASTGNTKSVIAGIGGTPSVAVVGGGYHRGHTQTTVNQHHSTHHKNDNNKEAGAAPGGVGLAGVARNGLNAKIGLTDEVVMISTAQETGPDVSSIIYIVGGCTLGLMIILVAVLAAAYVRARKGSRTAESRGFLHVDTSGTGKDTSLSSGTGTASASGGSLFVRPESPHHYSSVSPCLGSGSYTYSSFQPNTLPHYTEISTIDSNSCKLAEMTIERCKVRLQSIIMEGTFAKVYKGTVLERDGSEEKVVVKTVIDHSSPVQMALLLHEGLALVGMVHKHVSTVIGVAAEEHVPPFLIYSDDGFRNLKRFLQRCRSGPGRPITPQEIVHMAIQIASGISFLHRQNVFHRDVAARNCVVDDKLIVKISDSALSRDLFPEDYHWMGEAESRPVKWIPPEAIVQPRSAGAPSADMWSFGVLLWELATLAQPPYAEIDHEDLFSFLKMGYRLSQPVNCPDELYCSMTRCWAWDPDDRPKWTQITADLQALYAQLAQYV